MRMFAARLPTRRPPAPARHAAADGQRLRQGHEAAHPGFHQWSDGPIGGACACGGGCASCISDRYDETDADSEPGAEAQPQAPRDAVDGAPDTPQPTGDGETKCPAFVSLTAAGKDPTVMVSRSSCRLKLGQCSTPRGTCGNTSDSGMAFEGTVKTAAGCTGQLAFMQNILSTDRVVTKADGTKECISVSSPHLDGGPPWKGCVVDVTAAGTHTVKSDDCPGRRLDDQPSVVSITDSFKLYLMWKAAGTQSWKPIANAKWAWSGAVARTAGAKDEDACASRYTLTAKSHTDGTGAASTDMPVSSPKIRDVKPGPCAAAEPKPDK